MCDIGDYRCEVSLKSYSPCNVELVLQNANFWGFLVDFYPNVTTLRSGLCCRNSVCLTSVCLSVYRLSSVTLVHPTQGFEAFGKISSPLCTLAIL